MAETSATQERLWRQGSAQELVIKDRELDKDKL